MPNSKGFVEFVAEQLGELGDGMETFRPNERQELKTYYEVPPDTIEDRAELVERAELAVRAAD